MGTYKFVACRAPPEVFLWSSSWIDETGRTNLVCAEDATVLRYGSGTPRKCDSTVLRSLSERFWANKGLASSFTAKVHRKGKMTLGAIRGEFSDYWTCWDSLKQRKPFSKWEQGRACTAADSAEISNPNLYHLHYYLILSSSSVKWRDILPEFEVWNASAWAK